MSKGHKKSKVEKKSVVNKHGLPRTIPEAVKLEVRRRCGFGCVICGLGIYEYEHFSPDYKDATKHDLNGITLLCPNHHAKKTKGTLSVATVEKFNKNPKALSKGFVHEEFDLHSTELEVSLGTTVFKRTPVLLQIGDESILSVIPGERDEPFYLSATLRDNSGNVIMEIDRNEWKTNTDHWDCKASGDTITIRKARGKIELVIRQAPPNELHIERLVMVHRGYKIELHENSYTRVTAPDGGGFQTKDFMIQNWEVGIRLISTSDSYSEIIGDNAREGGGQLGFGVLQTFLPGDQLPPIS